MLNYQMVGYCHHDLNGSRPVVTSCPSCAKDCGALRAGDQRGERGEAAEGRRVGGAAHVLSGAGAVSRCCGVLWAVGLGKFCVGKHGESGLLMYIIYNISWYFMMCTYIMYNYIHIFIP